MLRLHVVTTSADQHASFTEEERAGAHGTVIMMRLVEPWSGTDRIVCADSYFASVGAAMALKAAGLRFIGVVKTAHRLFPLAFLSARELCGRGDQVTMVHRDESGRPDLMAVVWVDRERRYFIASASSNQPGTPYERLRWRETEEGGAQRVSLIVRQPRVAEIYYGCCSQIDRHNRCRQDDLRLEKKLGTHDWSTRVNHSLLGICLVDSWMLYHGARGPAATLLQTQFYEQLATELIDNTFDVTGTRQRAVPANPEEDVTHLAYGVGTHLVPTTKRRHPSTNHLAQRQCLECSYKTSLVCSTCRDTPGVKEAFLCGPRTGRSCFAGHMRSTHAMSV